MFEINRSLVPLLLQLQKNNQSQVDIVFYSFESPEGQSTFWHSSAHVLGQALGRQKYRVKVLKIV